MQLKPMHQLKQPCLLTEDSFFPPLLLYNPVCGFTVLFKWVNKKKKKKSWELKLPKG